MSEDLLDMTRALKDKRLTNHDRAKIAAFADFLRLGVPPAPDEPGTPEHAAWREKYADKLPEANRRLAICDAVTTVGSK